MVPVETLLKEALQLPVDLRAELVGQLMKTLPAPVPAAPAPASERDDVPRSISWEGGQAFLED